MHETYDRDILKLVVPARIPATLNPRLGIVGGGQLAKMTALAGIQLGCDVVVLERNNYSPAATMATSCLSKPSARLRKNSRSSLRAGATGRRPHIRSLRRCNATMSVTSSARPRRWPGRLRSGPWTSPDML